MDSTPQAERKFPSRRNQNPHQHLYDRQFWRGPNGLQKFIMRRDPVCRICHRNKSSVAHHIKDHKGNWALFSDDANLMGICKTCHDQITAKQSGGFGNVYVTPAGPKCETSSPQATGAGGKQFQASSVSASKIDKALAFDKNELLSGIPE